jgi:NB-ARC domain
LRIGTKHEEFSVTFSLFSIVETEQFVARQKELAEMHAILRGDGSRRVAVLHGLGGIGKTQLSITYAKQYKNSYSAVFWLNIKDVDSLKQSFAKVADQIIREHPSTSPLSGIDLKDNLDEVVDAVKRWLSLPGNTRWLLIYDNYDSPKLAGNIDPATIDISKYLPESYQGSVIITTRSSQVTIGHRIQIQKLENTKECLEILANASRRKVSVYGKKIGQ